MTLLGGGGYETVSLNITRGGRRTAKVSRDIFLEKKLINSDLFALKTALKHIFLTIEMSRHGGKGTTIL